eukprot:6062105-Pyramimonas_sp.AAC.1
MQQNKYHEAKAREQIEGLHQERHQLHRRLCELQQYQSAELQAERQEIYEAKAQHDERREERMNRQEQQVQNKAE